MAGYQALHDWDLDPRDAVALQKELQGRVRVAPLERPAETVAGADISFNRDEDTLYAGVVVVRLADMATIEAVAVATRGRFPYVPGLLSFRELPAVLEAWSRLRTEPDVVMFDGHGLAHPRRLGIASHAGLVLDRPTLGCGKSVLVGTYREPPRARGRHTPLVHRGETVGVALRTRTGVSPVFVSVGHRIDLAGAIELALRAGGGYRLPEPTRRAHLLVNDVRRGVRAPDR